MRSPPANPIAMSVSSLWGRKDGPDTMIDSTKACIVYFEIQHLHHPPISNHACPLPLEAIVLP